jgi:hypothetical protein
MPLVAGKGKDVFTAKELEVHLRRHWAMRGCDIADGERIGIAVGELVAHSMERNSGANVPYIDLWIAIFDEFISWEVSLLSVLKNDRNIRVKWTAFDRSILMLLIKIIADSTAIRHLILLGFDTSARTLLRSTSEYMELFVAILDDPKLAREFVKTDTPEKAKEFWKAYLASGGIRKRVYQAWRKYCGGNDRSGTAEWFTNWGSSFNDILSAMLHPSYAGGLFTAIPFKASYPDENWLGVWGDKSEGSVDTIYTYASYFFPILLLKWDFPFEGFGEHMVEGNIKYNKARELHRHIKIGRGVLGSLILSLGIDSNRPHVFPEIDMSIWEHRRKKGTRSVRERTEAAHG